MTWQDYLTDEERSRWDRLVRIREEASEAVRAERRILKSKCEHRMRKEAQRDA